jgi:phosphoglycerate dehydrogenase-like enzyme
MPHRRQTEDVARESARLRGSHESVAWLPDQEALSLVGEVPAGYRILTGAEISMEDSNAAFVVPPPQPSVVELSALQAMPNVQVVQLMSSGHERALPYRPLGAALCTARGAHDVPVAEWVLAAILAEFRGLPRFVRQQAERAWLPFESRTLGGREVVLVGYGSIAAAVEARLLPFGVKISRVARSERRGVYALAYLDSLLRRADVVVLLLPGGPETTGLFDARRLDLLKTGALLVNAGRGPVVDTTAMTERVQAGRFRVALDVVDPEPLPPTHELWRLDGALLTPHVASNVDSRLGVIYEFIGRQLRSFATGQRLENVVDDA